MTTYVWDVGARRVVNVRDLQQPGKDLRQSQEFVVVAPNAVAAAALAEKVAPGWDVTYMKRYAEVATFPEEEKP